jgi:hypothetical protein
VLREREERRCLSAGRESEAGMGIDRWIDRVQVVIGGWMWICSRCGEGRILLRDADADADADVCFPDFLE